MARALKAKLQEIGLDLIDEPAGVNRMDIDPEEVQWLADNIEAVGLLQPIIVRPVDKRFEIIAGHRRYLAHRLLKKKGITCIVRQVDDLTCALARASENRGRVDLSPIEEAAVYSNLCDNYGLTVDAVGEHMGVTPGIVRRRLDLLKMPPQLQKAIHHRKISYGVAEELWRITDIGVVDYYLGFAIDHGVTVAVARGWVKDFRDSKRRQEADVGGGGGVASPYESRPVYVACDVCLGSMELGSEEVIRACPGCVKLIRDALKRE